MSRKKFLSGKHGIRTATSEMDKLEKTHKSELRMISTVAFKFRSKFIRVDDPRRWQGETEACNVRMYETHFPGFCYLKDGKYRRKVMSNINTRTADSFETSNQLKALLFTDNELDVRKVICLHLLSTHVQNRRHIQRKDGRTCLFVKSQVHGNRKPTLHPTSQRSSIFQRDPPSIYDRMLPRYVVDVRFMDRIVSNLSLYMYDTEIPMEDEQGRRRRFQIPIYINKDIRTILNSVCEALEAVNSPKLKKLVNLLKSPEALRDLLSHEDIQDYITDLASNQLVTRTSAYEIMLTNPVFDKIPEAGSLDIVTQVLEIASDSGLRNALQLIRKTICRRYEELNCNPLPGRRKGTQVAKGTALWNISKTSFTSGESSTKVISSGDEMGSQADIFNEIKTEQSTSSSSPRRSARSSKNMITQSVKSIFPHHDSASERNRTAPESSQEFQTIGEVSTETSMEHKTDPRIQHYGRYQENELMKYDLKSLNNSQRILLGLKVASMKNRPVNMHQFEGKKKVDMASLISSIMRPATTDPHGNESFASENVYGTGQMRAKKVVSNIGNCPYRGLENLTKGLLSNFRHEISTAENKNRVKEFITTARLYK